ncbi:MAG: hypothetical protein A2174_01205 [Candidatus Portnoybacteria bacterium RBG_13_41_18]|uniref:Uncharacterized protein n=1 Tax=Candidatus Portnoybacteria bacterium RBG_13_41_18 TaxID=1801991 RepID=A0A1G2F5T6_9BACT|nr:MAG: hypothetical protein A2174_01205 [Candidatus Portnoybacteria bacterium RBG_13_41_18]
MQKSYNPFKMWGSWAGFLIGLLLAFLTSLEGAMPSPYFHIIFSRFNPILYFSGNYFGLILSLIMFFILGWLIHSIIRKLKN